MANPFSNISSKIEQHPVITSVIVGGLGIVVTIYYIKRNQSANQQSSTQPNMCTDANGDLVDCTTGQPIGTSGGGFSLQPTNNSSDVLTAIGNLSLQLQNMIAAMGNNGNTNNPPPTNNPPATNPPITNPPVIAPGPGGAHPPAGPPRRTVTVAQWSSTNTPWNSTLWGIAHHFGESLTTVEKLNPQIKNPNIIHPGQKVYY